MPYHARVFSYILVRRTSVLAYALVDTSAAGGRTMTTVEGSRKLSGGGLCFSTNSVQKRPKSLERLHGRSEKFAMYRGTSTIAIFSVKDGDFTVADTALGLL